MVHFFANSTDKNSLGGWFRKRRFLFFEKSVSKIIANKATPIRILDVGGVESYWINNGFQNKDKIIITLLNLTNESTNSLNITSTIGDATNLEQFMDNEFDIVFSNSVIEHLYNLENQVLMSKEVQRVGKYHFIQTPNKNFFIEPHYLLPFFQFIPKSIRYYILTKTRLSRGMRWDKEYASQYLAEIELVSFTGLKRLFPHSKIHKETFLGMNKSFTAHNFDN